MRNALHLKMKPWLPAKTRTHQGKRLAHLLRKAFKLTLVCPGDREYRRFADRLLQFYRDACAAQRDETLSADDRDDAFLKLADRLTQLCKKRYFDPTMTH
jgi:hypothetical protein